MASFSKSNVNRSPKAAKINIMEPPKKYACFKPCFLDLSSFIKKLTVIGIIGKTQGVINANKPAPKETKNTNHQDFSFVALPTCTALSVVVFFLTTFIVSLAMEVSVAVSTFSPFTFSSFTSSIAFGQPLILKEMMYLP